MPPIQSTGRRTGVRSDDHVRTGGEIARYGSIGRMSTDLRGFIARNLAGFECVRSDAVLMKAAVALVVLIDGEGRPCVPIFQRTSDMSRHAGQMALPGGKIHEGEDQVSCAIRELREELGLEVERAAVLGRLDDFDTRSGFTITPIVIWSGEDVSVLKPSRHEVAHLFIVPLSVLREAVAAAGAGRSEAFSLHLPGVQVFAPTGAILYQFSEVALDGRTVRVADFFQPTWTHR
jgi:8-oxo-dGTP pyrophosphatase MutT (NUDIX family)